MGGYVGSFASSCDLSVIVYLVNYSPTSYWQRVGQLRAALSPGGNFARAAGATVVGDVPEPRGIARVPGLPFPYPTMRGDSATAGPIQVRWGGELRPMLAYSLLIRKCVIVCENWFDF